MDYPIGTAVVGGWSAPFILLSVWLRVLTNPLPDGVTKASPSAPLSAGAPRGVMVLSSRTMNDINNTTCQASAACVRSGRYISIQLFSDIVDSWIIHIPLLLCLPDPFFFVYVCICAITACPDAGTQMVYVGRLSLPPPCASSPSEKESQAFKALFLWTAHQSLRKHYTAVFEVNIQFFFSSKLWMRSSGHGSAAVAPHFFKLYVCAPMQMRQLCFCGRKDWFKLTENDWFSELAFILSSPFFSHSFTTVFVFPLCWAEAFRNKVKKKTEWPSRNISKGRN